MGTVSHTNNEARKLIDSTTTARPPTQPFRRCEATTIRGGNWHYPLVNGKQDFQNPVWNPPTEMPCRMGASPWVPEVNFCAHHMPRALVPLATQRAELWASLLGDVWREVCAEYPMPDDARG